MNSKLIFLNFKKNILRYTVAFSAVVHLIGIIYFPSWGTLPNQLSEKIIKIKTVVQQPKKPVQKKPPEQEKQIEKKVLKPTKASEPITTKIRKRTPEVKSVEAVPPSPAVKSSPVPISSPNQNYQPMKVIQRNISIPHPVTNFKVLAKAATLTEPFNIQSPARQVTQTPEILSPNPTTQKKQFTQVALANKPQTPSPTINSSQNDLSRLKTTTPQPSPATPAKQIICN